MNTEVTLGSLITHFAKAVLGTDAVHAKWHVLLVPAISFDLYGLMLCPVVLKGKRNALPLHHLFLYMRSVKTF